VDPLMAAAVAFLGGGMLTGVAAFIRARPGATKDIADAAAGLVVVQESTITRLNTAMASLEGRCDAMEDELRFERRRNDDLARTLRTVTAERDRYRAERDDLRHRVEHVEAELRRVLERPPRRATDPPDMTHPATTDEETP
jgi:chromosome segregation ATPase